MKLEINIEKKYFLIILGAILVLGAVVFAGAVAKDTSVFHKVDQIDWADIIPSDVEVDGRIVSRDFVAVDPAGLMTSIITRCDWSGWGSRKPWEEAHNFECTNGIVARYWTNRWIAQGCATSHQKGYNCALNTDGDGSYGLHCYTTSEAHGEWGTDNPNGRRVIGGREPIDLTVATIGSIVGSGSSGTIFIGPKVEYIETTGKWKLTTVGKSSNSDNKWTIESCEAGGFQSGFS